MNDNAPRAGNGWRLLTNEEKRQARSLSIRVVDHRFEYWSRARDNWTYSKYPLSFLAHYHYRTKLTPEQFKAYVDSQSR